MFLLSRILEKLNLHHQLEELADQLAAACDQQVWERVFPAANRLGRAQRRGFIRARALAVVHAELQSVSFDPQLHQHLHDLALQRVVDRTTLSLQKQQAVRPPLRRAA